VNKFGQAARFAYNPVALVAYIEALERSARDGYAPWSPASRPAAWRSDVEGRILRRWRTVARGVTMDAAHRMLSCYSVSPEEFTVWCQSNGHQPVLRDTDTRR
jgi:hypothetical protein